ncbi:MAG: extracellular solute-binding protein [Clostridia bacterium]|nr:extracellular solute-binding protein [Clostridia bacterium]
MKSMKKLVAVLLVAAMVLACCACGGSATNNNALEGNTYVAGFPIVKEKEKLEIMTVKQVEHGDFDEMGFTSYYEEMTNIDIEWMVSTLSEYESNLTLMFQSKNLPDVISLPTGIFGAERLLKYSKNGQVIQLDELIDKYAPNIKKLLETSKEFKMAATSADGKIYSLPTVQTDSNNHERFPQKMYIRKTWLDNLGLDVPKTAEEFYEMLRAFKNDDPNGNGQPDEIPFATRGIEPSFFGSFGISFNYSNNSLCVDENGKVQFGYGCAATKEALSYYNRLHSLGLVENYESDSKWKTKLKNGLVGVFYSLADYTVVGSDLADEYVMVAPFDGSENADPVMSVSGTYYTNTFVITDKCENPIAAIRWVDYLYSTDGYYLVTYGQPGDMIEKDKDGNWSYTDYDRSKHRFTFTPGLCLPYYVDDETLSVWKDKDKADMTADELADLQLTEDTKNTYLGKYEPENLFWQLPYDEKAQEVIDQYSDNIFEYAGQMMGEFAFGYRNIDTEWDAYIAELNKKGLQLVLDEYQRLYDAVNQ